MSEDDRAVMERLAALEAEVKADADAQRVRKEAALVRLREQRAKQQQESQALVPRSVRERRPTPDHDSAAAGIGSALELAQRANGMKQELTRAPKQGDKSWVKSGVASMVLGPLGWLYAGSMREAVPASAAWLVFAAIASKIIPVFLLMPVLLVVLPLSGIAGVVYALQYNRSGGRQRLFDKTKDGEPKKQLTEASPRPVRRPP